MSQWTELFCPGGILDTFFCPLDSFDSVLWTQFVVQFIPTFAPTLAPTLALPPPTLAPIQPLSFQSPPSRGASLALTLHVTILQGRETGGGPLKAVRGS